MDAPTAGGGGLSGVRRKRMTESRIPHSPKKATHTPPKGDSNRSLRRPTGGKGAGMPRQQAEAGFRSSAGSGRPTAESPILQKSNTYPVKGGFEPEPAPTNGRKRGHGCPRQQAEAGCRDSAGGGRPTAESPILQKKQHIPRQRGDSNRSLRRPTGGKGAGMPRQQAEAGRREAAGSGRPAAESPILQKK
jgi:hypothetical protein